MGSPLMLSSLMPAVGAPILRKASPKPILSKTRVALGWIVTPAPIFSELLRLLVEADFVARAAERGSHRQAAYAAADDSDSKLSRHFVLPSP
jgi:hypothetical protein